MQRKDGRKRRNKRKVGKKQMKQEGLKNGNDEKVKVKIIFESREKQSKTLQ